MTEEFVTGRAQKPSNTEAAGRLSRTTRVIVIYGEPLSALVRPVPVLSTNPSADRTTLSLSVVQCPVFVFSDVVRLLNVRGFTGV